MKHILDYVQPEKKRKNYVLSQKMKALFREWALEAYKLDKSKTVSAYYKYFLTKLREKYRESDNKKEFFKNEIIEV